MTADVLQGYPLSPQQKRLWLLKQSESSQPYCVEGSLLIEGLLDRKHLQQAIKAVVREYEMLHTTFQHLQGMSLPLQVVGTPNVCWLPDCDLTAYSEQEQHQQLQILAHTLASLSSDLEQDAALRVVFAILSPNKYVLLINLPGLCADNRSLQTLTTLFYHHYRALEGPRLYIDEPMQYALVAEWLNELLTAEELEVGRVHWQRQHISAHINATLPFEDAHTHSAPFRPCIIERSIEQTLSAQIERYMQISQIPASTFFLTCWHVLLWQLTRQTELCISVTCDGRSTEDLIPVIGPLARSLPLLSHLKATLPFSELLAQIQTAYQTAYEWQECFQGDLFAGEQQTTKDPGFLPISFEYISPATMQGDSHLSLFLFSQRAYLDRFTLKLSCSVANDLFLTEFQYDASRVSEDSVICLADSFSALLENILQDPSASLETLLPLSAQAKTFLLVTLNNTKREYPENSCLPQMFEEQVIQNPERIAVVAQDLQMTYAELNRRANQLAHYLRQVGVRPGSLIGLCIERSPEMVIGLLGILKAGAAYVPLDPSYPKQRLAFMLEDAQVALLITRQDLLTLFPAFKQQTFCLDTGQEVLRSAPVANPQGEIASEMLAYVLYTSGSTGKPKGVIISHQALSNHMQWMQSTFPLCTNDSVLQKTPFSFDASVWELFAPLLAGVRLVIAEPERQQDSVYLIQEISLQQITILQVVPMLLRILLDNPGFATCQSLKRVFCGGETLSRELAQRVFACLDVELINLYGPTETTIETVVWSCTKEEKQVVVPIGHPIDNIEAYVLDTNLQLKPFFASGELYLAGVGLAYGYLNQPELTAQQFIPHPFSTQPGARLYKTGDFARYRPDGAIECLGRADNQVKIRGFRVEIDEITHNILQHPAIGDCIVLVQEVAPGVTSLIAYLVTSLTQGSITEIMRSYLAEELAEYMIPDLFIVIETLPLLPNGKVDRKALPSPRQILDAQAEEHLPPRSPTEQILTEIWAQLLGCESVSIHHSFFHLGGHSLLASQLIARVREIFQVEISIRSIFEQPTIEALAKVIDTARGDTTSQAEYVIRQAQPDTTYPLSFAQEHLWFLWKLEPENTYYSIPVAVQIAGELEIALLEASFHEIVKRHETLRTTFTLLDGQPRQVISPFFKLAIPLIDLTALSQEEQNVQTSRLHQQEALRQFDLEGGPLLFATLLRLGRERHIALFTLHHIVLDGWSLSVLTHELAAFYAAFAAQRPVSLSPLSIQYKDYAVWQRHYLTDKTLERLQTYWERQLEGAPQRLTLPTDHPYPSVPSFHGGEQTVSLAVELSQAVKNLCHETQVTPFMALLTVFQSLLKYLTGRDDLLIGTDSANREHLETEPLIGFFVNLLPLRLRVSGDPTFRALLGQTRQVTLDAYTHQELPFAKIVRTLQARRTLSHMPLCQVLFVFQNLPALELEFSGLSLSPLPGPDPLARFDLAVFFTETPTGFSCTWNYNLNLFHHSTIANMIRLFTVLLQEVVPHPDTQLSALMPILEQTKRQLEMEQKSLLQSPLARLKSFQPQAISVQNFDRRTEKGYDKEEHL